MIKRRQQNLLKKGLLSITALLSGIFFSPLLLAKSQSSSIENQLFQVATIDALARGVYDGDFSYRDLISKGDLGIGTFTAIDGEMVAIDGQYYQSLDNGQLRQVSPEQMAPFAEVINFKPSFSVDIKNTNSYEDLSAKLLPKFADKNLPYVVRIDGTFSNLVVRSLRKQKPPYVPLAQAAKEQAVLNLKNVKGTAVGFWFPQYWEGFAVMGFHFHFATADRKMGGHVLKMAVTEGQAQIAPIQNIVVHLPDNSAFAKADLNPETSREEVRNIEGSGR